MLKIHKLHSKHKLLLTSITSICITFGLLEFYYLTCTPELLHAESVQYPPEEVHPNLSDITYMQDVNPEICANTKEADTEGNYQYQLIDKRDNKTYWVAKLKDGNCWMTQNLALDLSTSKPLSSADSDVSGSWMPTASTQQSIITVFPSEANLTFSYNPGEYFYATPAEGIYCNEESTKLEGCPNWFLKVGLSKDDSGDKQAHYLAGNYYSYNIATAGYELDKGDSSDSICPKGWRLPLNKAGDNGSFYNLVNELAVAEAVVAPYYFVYTGSVITNGLGWRGVSGYLWSSAAFNDMYSRILIFQDGVNDVNPSYLSRRDSGISVRCVATSEISNNVDILINPTISLDVADEVTVEKNETNPSIANLDVKVSSNQRYSVGISAANPSLTSSTNSTTIPAKSGLLNTAENGWGIKLKDNTEFTALTSDLQTFYTASGAEIKTIPFTIGISTAPDLPNGEYSTNITVTATQD